MAKKGKKAAAGKGKGAKRGVEKGKGKGKGKKGYEKDVKGKGKAKVSPFSQISMCRLLQVLFLMLFSRHLLFA